MLNKNTNDEMQQITKQNYQLQNIEQQLREQDSLLISKNHTNDQLIKKNEMLEARMERKEKQLQ